MIEVSARDFVNLFELFQRRHRGLFTPCGGIAGDPTDKSYCLMIRGQSLSEYHDGFPKLGEFRKNVFREGGHFFAANVFVWSHLLLTPSFCSRFRGNLRPFARAECSRPSSAAL